MTALSSLILGNHKFVLFIDYSGSEKNGIKIVENMLFENNVSYEKSMNKNINFCDKTSVILDPISKLELKLKDEEIYRLVQSLKNNKSVNQIFGYASAKNISSKLLIPFLDHMSDITITLHTDQHLSILTKKSSGAKMKEFVHELAKGKTFLKEFQSHKPPAKECERSEPEPEATFKISQFKSDELEAKKNLKLPFEIM
jgi:hypothetical protein